jgi:tRNA(Ile)-lysidine synthase TilS/MesJ
MTPIDFPPLIDQLLRAGAALMISISGGKDSQAMLKALFRDYKNHG